MLEATLLYNPLAGRNRERKTRTVERVVAELALGGFHVRAVPTYAQGSAASQAREAVRLGAEAVFACGGDGTVHDVLQGTAEAGVLLGIIPMGSANALAQELKIPREPLQAARSLAPDSMVGLRTTVIERLGASTRYSLCMAGAGPDGLLMYRMLAVSRSRFGRWRYYEHALRLFLSGRFRPFTVEVTDLNGLVTKSVAVSAMALRVGDLQGVFSGIARGASVYRGTLHVVLVRPPARLTLPLWFVLSWIGMGRLHPGVCVAEALQMRCDSAVPWQVDGEWAGRGAAVVHAAGPIQRMLVPRAAALSADRASSLPRSIA